MGKFTRVVFEEIRHCRFFNFSKPFSSKVCKILSAHKNKCSTNTDTYSNRTLHNDTHHHTIIRAVFVCLSVCLFVPLLLRGPLTDLHQTWWVHVGGPRNCPWGVLFEKVNGSTGQTSLFRSRQHQAEATPLQKAHGVFCRARRLLPSKRHTASKSLIPSTGIFTSGI